MNRFFLPLLFVCGVVFWTSTDAIRSNRESVKSSSSGSAAAVKRSRHVPAPKVRPKAVVHPLLTFRRRVALVTKPGAILEAAQRGSTPGTSIAPPVQGGPPVFTTRVIRTASVTTPTSSTKAPMTGSTTAATPHTSTPTAATSGSATTTTLSTASSGSSSSTGTTATATTTAGTSASTSTATTSAATSATSSSSTSTSTSATTTGSSTTTSYTPTCAPCTYPIEMLCVAGAPQFCMGRCCATGLTCQPSPAGDPPCPYSYLTCCR